MRTAKPERPSRRDVSAYHAINQQRAYRRRRQVWRRSELSVGDLIMARRQLLNLKGLAERHYLGAATDKRAR
jgi:hypothetical protein